MRRRAQTAIEFLVLLGFMLLVFTAFFAVMHERSSIIIEQNRYGELTAAGDIVRDEALTAQQVHDGYRRVFDLPTMIQGRPYTIALVDRSELVIETADQQHILFLPINISIMQNGIPSADGPVATGKNIIKKTGGNVTITPVTALINATPNPCTRSGATCTSTLRWYGSAEHSHLQVWVQQNDGAESYLGSSNGCTVQPNSKAYDYTIGSLWYTFRLYSATGCDSSERVGIPGQELGTVVVTSVT
jgi:hypothetical protein